MAFTVAVDPRILVEALERRLPEDPFPQYAPHLSVARPVREDCAEVMAALGAAMAGSGGAIHATCKVVVLLERTGGGPWQVQLDLPPGQPRLG